MFELAAFIKSRGGHPPQVGLRGIILNDKGNIGNAIYIYICVYIQATSPPLCTYNIYIYTYNIHVF